VLLQIVMLIAQVVLALHAHLDSLLVPEFANNKLVDAVTLYAQAFIQIVLALLVLLDIIYCLI